MIGNLLTYLLTAATLENVVLSTGFGSSLLLRVVRRQRDFLLFGLLLCGFSVLTTLLMFPLDIWLGKTWTVKLLRPLIIIGVTSLLYIIAVFVVRRFFSRHYARLVRLLPLAAFNNLVVVIALIINHQFALTLLEALSYSLGACLGFMLLTWLVAEAMDRMDHSDVPKAFRGMPTTFLYLGILAMALLGTSSSYS